MNLVANDMCSNLLNNASSLSLYAHRLSIMVGSSLEFEYEIFCDYFDLDEIFCDYFVLEIFFTIYIC